MAAQSSRDTRPRPGGSGGATAGRNVRNRRRGLPSWEEQMKREAWGRFWGQVNKGAMRR